MPFNINTAKPLEEKKNGFDITTAKPFIPIKSKPEPFVESKSPLLGGTQVIPESPLNLQQRAILGFGNRKTKKEWLDKTFGIGNVKELEPDRFIVKKENTWYAVDPRGRFFADLPGDIADLVSEIPEWGGQIIGTGIGAASALPSGAGVPFGATIGAGSGRAGGRAIKQSIGQILGIYPTKTTKELLKEQATSGAIGAGTELAFAGLGKALTAGKRLLQRIPRIMSGIPEETMERVAERGASEVLTPEKIQPGYLDNVSARAKEGLDFLVEKTHKQFADIIDDAVEKNPNLQVNINSVFDRFKENLTKIGYLDQEGNIRLMTKLEPIARKKLVNFISYVADLGEKGILGLQDAFRVKGEMWRLAEQLDPSDSWIAKQFYSDLTNQMIKVVPKLASANKDYMMAETLKTILAKKWNITPEIEKLGIEIEPTAQLKSLLKKGGTNRNILEKLNSLLPKEYKFVDDYLDGVAAQQIVNSTGFWSGIRKTATELIFRIFEIPIKTGTKILPPVAEKIGIITKPATEYLVKPFIARQITKTQLEK